MLYGQSCSHDVPVASHGITAAHQVTKSHGPAHSNTGVQQPASQPLATPVKACAITQQFTAASLLAVLQHPSELFGMPY